MSYHSGRVIFLDRDGVINRKAPLGEYIRTWSEIEFLSGAVEAIAQLSSTGFRMFVVSNQRGIARGIVKESDVHEMHRRMLQVISKAGGTVEGVYYCPHDYKDNCSCRKPRPGMLIRAANEHGFELAGSWMVGDSESDVAAGKNVGCRTLQIVATHPASAGVKPDAYVRDLSAAASLILSGLNIG